MSLPLDPGLRSMQWDRWDLLLLVQSIMFNVLVVNKIEMVSEGERWRTNFDYVFFLVY